MGVKDSVCIVGAHGNRRAADFYPTPPECTVALMDFLEARATLYNAYPDKDRCRAIWEPACGDGAISKVLEARGYEVLSSDIRSDESVYGEKGVDFLSCGKDRDFDWIITNPPFCLAEQFIRKCVEINRPFALLLKSQYWNSSKRLSLFRETKPRYILPLTWRPDFTGQGNSLMDMCWNVWTGNSGFYGAQYIPLEKPKGVLNADHQ